MGNDTMLDMDQFIPPSATAESDKNPLGWLIITLSVILFIFICLAGFLVYQNMELKKKILEIPPTSSPAPVPPIVAPTSNSSEFSSGWYWGTMDQKKPDTPLEWVYQEAGRSSCWHAPNIECGYLPD